jgi:capsular polysaccharide export protein
MTLDNWPSSAYSFGFSLRKHALLKQFLPAVHIRSLDKDGIPLETDWVLVWGAAEIPLHWPENVHIVRVEDGFLRSVGLGADLVRPVSWVFDHTGIYFDATKPSDLENLLANYDFDEALLSRAKALQQSIIQSGLTKYNVGWQSWQRPENGKTIILVPGQVETDASIRLGALGVSGNLELLQAVRQRNPAAYIVYKPHPDVVAGLRAQGLNESRAADFCDEQVSEITMGALLCQVDEVHVMTSLTGYEALIRGLKVVCYGMPFYAGWGLTEDLLHNARRFRRLSCEALTAAALVIYPVYISRQGDCLLSAEESLQELIHWRLQEAPKIALWRRPGRWLLRKILGRP